MSLKAKEPGKSIVVDENKKVQKKIKKDKKEKDEESDEEMDNEKKNKTSRSRTMHGQPRPDTTALMAVELTRLREESQQFKIEREEWLKREGELTDRIRFLESQLYRYIQDRPQSDIPSELEEYQKLSTDLRLILSKLDHSLTSLYQSQITKT